jgi:hypothetical protein
MRKFLLIAGVVALAACNGSRRDMEKQLAEMQLISAQKDSLLRDVTETSAFIADLSKQVSTVRNVKAGRNTNGGDLEDNLTPRQRRDQLLAQVEEITGRVNQAESRLNESRKRVTELTGMDAEKSKRLAEFDSTLASYKQIVENQKTQVASLTEQVEALTTENTRLKADNAQLVANTESLTTERDHLTTERNTVYYVVASKKSLMDRHVIEKSGGFLGLGGTPVVAREIDRNQFVEGDKTSLWEIPLPDSTKEYRIVSRQDLAALEIPPDKGGAIKGSLRIRDPEAFWAASKYLVVIEK